MTVDRRRDPRTRSLVVRLAEAVGGGPVDRGALLAGLRAAGGRELYPTIAGY